VAGRTLLEIALARFRAFGVHDVIINTHHYAELVAAYLRANDNFGMRIEISHEDILLDTGGGLKQAAHFFVRDGDVQAPFLLHNVDVMSAIDLRSMVRFHEESGSLATVAVQDRKTSRHLLFDAEGQLCGRRKVGEENDELVGRGPAARALAFSGIHVTSPRIFALMTEEGVFSIIDAYLRLAASGEKIVAFRADESYWRDLGRPESIAEAARDVENGTYTGA
jgi:NDP-sugar pyrophosphorylase family protein